MELFIDQREVFKLDMGGRKEALMMLFMRKRILALVLACVVFAAFALRESLGFGADAGGTFCPPRHRTQLPTCPAIRAFAQEFATEHNVLMTQLVEPYAETVQLRGSTAPAQSSRTEQSIGETSVKLSGPASAPSNSSRVMRLSVAYLAIGDDWDKKESGGCFWWWQTDCVGSDSAIASLMDALSSSTLHDSMQIEVLLFYSSTIVPPIFERFIRMDHKFAVQPVFLDRKYYESPSLRADEVCCQPWAHRDYSRFYTGMNYWRLYGMFDHPRLFETDYIWTLDLDLKFEKPLEVDPVALMEESGAVIGYTQLRVERAYSVPDDELTHWARCMGHPRALALTRMDRRAFTGNNIILKTSFFRSVQYRHLMKYIDTGLRNHPIFTQRWTDQNLYWLTASLFLAPGQLTYLSNAVLSASHTGAANRYCGGPNASPDGGPANVWQHYEDHVEHVPASAVKPGDYI